MWDTNFWMLVTDLNIFATPTQRSNFCHQHPKFLLSLLSQCYFRVTLSGLSKTISQMSHNRNTSVYSRQSNIQSNVAQLR